MTPDAVHSMNTVTIHPFVARFPARDHHYLTAWFHYAVSQGARTPEAVLEVVQRVVSRKLEWSVSTTGQDLCRGVLLALTLYRPEALAYATTLVSQEAPDA